METSILKEINPEYSLVGVMVKLKLQYFGHLMWSTNSLEKTLMLGKIEGRRRTGQQRKRLLDGITDSVDMTLSKLQEIVEDWGARCNVVHGVTKSQTWLSDLTTLTNYSFDVHRGRALSLLGVISVHWILGTQLWEHCAWVFKHSFLKSIVNQNMKELGWI